MQVLRPQRARFGSLRAGRTVAKRPPNSPLWEMVTPVTTSSNYTHGE